MSPAQYLDVEIHLIGSNQVSLRCPGQQEYVGDAHLDDDLCRRLLELEHAKNFRGYGKALFEATFPAGSETRQGIYSIFDSARTGERRLRLRLNIGRGTPSLMHGLHWELLTDGEDFEVGRSPETVFSRYVSRPHTVGPPPASPRMLCVIAAPVDAHRHKMAPIDYDYTRSHLEKSFADLRGSLEIEFLGRPVTPERLREQLRTKRYELLHIHGHGTLPRRGESAVVLEDADYKVNFTTESALRRILLGLRDLKMVTLVACHGAAQPLRDDLLSGLAGGLVKQNVPAVVAMRRAISMKVGFRFTEYFYRQIADTPCVDAAINEARHRLYMDNPDGIDWSSPVLYMRLKDGLLWRAEERQAEVIVARRRYVKAATASSALLVICLLFWWQLAPGFHLADQTYLGFDSQPLELSGKGLAEEPSGVDLVLPPPSPINPVAKLEPIEKGRIGVGAIDGRSSMWQGDVARILSRQLQEQRPDLQSVVVPRALRSELVNILDGDLSFLGGGGTAQGGFEYVLLVAQTYEALALGSPFSPVSVACEMTIVSTREPVIRYQEVVGHTGNGHIKAVALEQALARCISSAEGHLP